jgi:hypothetical protein
MELGAGSAELPPNSITSTTARGGAPSSSTKSVAAAKRAEMAREQHRLSSSRTARSKVVRPARDDVACARGEIRRMSNASAGAPLVVWSARTIGQRGNRRRSAACCPQDRYFVITADLAVRRTQCYCVLALI